MPQNDVYKWTEGFGGSTEEQYIRNAYDTMGKFQNQLSNFQSPFYQQFAAYANKATPATGVNSYLQLLQSGGGNYAGSMAQALALKSNADKQRRDTINTGVQGFALKNVDTIANLMGQQGQIAGSAYSTKTQHDIASDQQGSPWQMLGGLGSIAGMFASGLFSGGASAAMALPALASDIRLKENIEYTGEETKDGIPIVDFNFIGDNIRRRGVIAQDVEKIRPDAVTEINGMKHVYYGRL